ncbi:hypothetical protein [Chryseobacterium sp. SC28]|uniref:hypothetical protein n=1 Tax=Chryseobacterium sp. SC28 TaxID=2268028 RepID=UPI000F64A784|nr:hypothetical protein [Chryseobacterium sp. SC28]RRQ45289.1 hypothetical protein DTW91_10900 [Chryseobacterium sp. SC28]
MQINTFWKILLKIIGLLLLFSCISLIPQFYSTLSFTSGNLDTENLLIVWLMQILSVIIYILIIRLFLFKTEWLVEKLKLEKNFNEERIDVNIKSSTVLNIAIIVIGGLMITESFPNFCSALFHFLQQKTLFKDYPDSHWLIFHFIKIIIGYLLLTNGKRFAEYIEKESVEEKKPNA